jgi:hypothetical protein
MPSLLRDLRVAPTLLLALSACGPNLADRVARAPAFDRPGETKCGVARSRSEPLVVEWPSAARAELEALSRTGVVAVRYTGCEMEVLASCSAPGKYAYTAITPKRDHVAIRNEDDLYANIPLGAAKLEGKLASSGELDVDMAIVGRYASDRAVVTADQLQGPDCARATHVVSALTVGAFDFSAGSDAAVSGGASVGNAGGGASSSSSRELLNSDGQRTACGTAKTSDASPPEACGAIVRLEVVPLGQAKQEGSVGASAAAAQAVAPPSPSGPGGEVVIDVVEQDQSWMASIEAGGQTFSCPDLVTFYKPCRLSGLPGGRARLKVTGTSTFERDVPVPESGRTTLNVWHQGHGLAIGMGIPAALSTGALVVGLLNGSGLNSNDANGNKNNSQGLNLALVLTGGTLAAIFVPLTAVFLFSTHNGVAWTQLSVVGDADGDPLSTWPPPTLQWGGLAAPTTLLF